VTCDETTLALGAYVLGALEPEERREVRDHLSRCPMCAAEYAEFQDIPALLDRVRLDDVQAGPATPSPDLFDRVAAAAAAEGRRVRHRWLVVAAAVGVLLAGGVGATVWVAQQGGEPTHAVASGQVHMTVQAAGDDTGTTLNVAVAGLPPGTQCRLFAVDADGVRHAAGEWNATYEGKAWFKGWTDVPRAQLANVVLLNAQGKLLVKVQV
jgi:hypothetical protein